jgi:GT2 family glycosyltransferase
MQGRRDVALVCGRRRERYPSASIYNRLCDIEWDTPVGEAAACGGDSLVRVEAFESVGGFRAQLIAGEEPELCLRLRECGWKVWRLDAEMTLHDAAIVRFRQWWIRAVRSGYGNTEVYLLHWRSPLVLWKRQVIRIIFWCGILPALIALSAVIYPLALVTLLIYPVQIFRIALIRGPTSRSSWIYALFVTISKFAEFQGLMKYFWRRLWHQPDALIEYKQQAVR